MSWEAHIKGPSAVLTELTRALEGGEQTLTARGDRFWLSSRTFRPLSDASVVRQEAERIVEALSGASRVLFDSPSPLEVGGIVEARTDGTQGIFVILEPEVVHVRGAAPAVAVSDADGGAVSAQPPPPATAWLAGALADPEKERALRLRDQASRLAWTDLYRLYEVVEAGLGGEEAIDARGWASRADLRRFKHSANSVSAAGDLARHGVESTEPPRSPMSLSEAQALVDALLTRWLDCVAI